MCYKCDKGQATVEFALVLPVLILIICAIIDFGWLFSHKLMGNSACRELTRYISINYEKVVDKNGNIVDINDTNINSIITSTPQTLEFVSVKMTMKSDEVPEEMKDKIDPKMFSIKLNYKVRPLTPFVATILDIVDEDNEVYIFMTSQIAMKLE